MVKPEFTKHIFADTFKNLLKRSHYDKINARDIITSSGFSNKTFYYHFRDKEDLIIWIFHKEIEEVLINVVDIKYASLLENKMIIKDPNFQKPFYLMLCKETDSYFSKFWGGIIENFSNNRQFYKEILNYEGQNNLKNHARQLFHQQFKENLIFLIHNNEFKVNVSSSLETDLLAEYLTNAFLGTLFYLIMNEIKDYHSNFISTNLTCITERCLDFLKPNARAEALSS